LEACDLDNFRARYQKLAADARRSLEEGGSDTESPEA
jgi:hypothetical protein